MARKSKPHSIQVGQHFTLTQCKQPWSNGIKVEVTEVNRDNITCTALIKQKGINTFVVTPKNLIAA